MNSAVVLKMLKYSFRFYSSAHRLMGSYSSKSLADLSKFLYIDEKKIQDSKLEKDIRYRSPTFHNINIPRLLELLKIFRKHSMYREQLIQARKKVISDIKTLQEIMDPPNEDIIKRIALRVNQREFLKQHLDIINKYYEVLQNVVLNEYLSIPNELHENTPKEKIKIIAQTEVTSSVTNHHLDIGRNLSLLKYFNSSFYFLLNDAALLECATMRFFLNGLQDNKFQLFLNPDTCNNFIVDGTCDVKNTTFFKLDDGQYSLVGNSSFSAFCALRVGQSVHSKFLPERNATFGRYYQPQTKYQSEHGLYSVFQHSNVNVIITSQNAQQMNEEFHNTLFIFKSAFEKLKVDFRISYQPASALLLGESLRANIELYSMQLQQYVEVAHLSIYGDFVSKRLLMMCHDKDKNYKFLNLIEGIAISYPVLLAYLLERSNKNEFLIPDCLVPFMYR